MARARCRCHGRSTGEKCDGRVQRPGQIAEVPRTWNAVNRARRRSGLVDRQPCAPRARPDGQQNTPLAKTTTVEITTNGAMSRISIAAGLAAVRWIRRVIADNRSRTAHLQRHGTYQQHPQEQMTFRSCRSSRSSHRGRKQAQEHDPGRCGQLLITRGPPRVDDWLATGCHPSRSRCHSPRPLVSVRN